MKETSHSQTFTQEHASNTEMMGWALQWEEAVLSDIVAHVPRNGNGRAHGTVGWEQLEVMATATEWPSNGSGPTSFPQTRAWALKWHGPALLQGDQGDGGNA
jgi:hypothetical protein